MSGRKRSRHYDAMRANPQASATYDATKRRHIKQIEAGEEVWCAICRKRIQYPTARGPGDKLSLSIDHIRRYTDADPATWDASNLRPAHNGCNRRRSAPGLVLATVETAPTEEYSRW